MPLFGRGGDEVKQAGGADPGAALTDALERYRAMPVPERAALVLATVAPAIAEHWDAARVDPRQLMEPTLVKPLIPQTGVHKETPEQYRARLVDLPVILAEAFNALVLARLLVPYDTAGAGSQILYSVSPDGLAALERGDVAEVVARSERSRAAPLSGDV